MASDALKAKFATGKKPTGSDFAEVIDTIDSKVGSTDLTSYATKQEITNLAVKTDVPTKQEYNALLARVEALETPQA